MTQGFLEKRSCRFFPSFPRERESSALAFCRTSFCVGAIALLTLFSCSFPRPNPLLEGPKLKNFKQAGPLTVYNRANLFDYMDGEAEAYLPFGFRLLYVSIFSHEKTDSRMVLEIYDMGTRDGAGGILKKYSSEGGSSLPGIADAAWADKEIILFRQANYFVRIFPDPSPENEVKLTAQEMLDLAREIAAAM
jgi:hypothetical protein